MHQVSDVLHGEEVQLDTYLQCKNFVDTMLNPQFQTNE
jgi:hypothetical protein